MFQTFPQFSGAWDSSGTVLLENMEAEKVLSISDFSIFFVMGTSTPFRKSFPSCPFPPFAIFYNYT